MKQAPADIFEPIAVSDEATVVSKFQADPRKDTGYQSEAALEAELIEVLRAQAYDYAPIHHEGELIANLRKQLELLNDYRFSDGEWERFFHESLANTSEGTREKTIKIQEDHVQVLRRDDGTSKNIKLIDKANIHNNRLQVINQFEVPRANASNPLGGRHDNRYDVTILVNGLPLVHIELKRRGVALKEAFGQINRYNRESFSAGAGLFEYVQIYVISNGTHTRYYSNTTRERSIEESSGRARGKKKTSNSYEFTMNWADATNKSIDDLIPFAKTFLAKHSILNILTRYCVLTVDRTLMVMRPYQIVATERILREIKIATNSRLLGKVEAGGYIWHTTGSGKTLTSFKTAQLASRMEGVEKVLFVVDRKDLDYQTINEYNRFEEGAANSNASTAVLTRQLGDTTSIIIITTIQKLAGFVRANKTHEVYDKHVVIIFDECHRSQFGEMHSAITKKFKKYNLFGFTGTPIFSANAVGGGKPNLQTTEQVFGEKLHTYTIVDAIHDQNVLPFRIDYLDTIQMGEDVQDKKVSAIDTERAFLAPDRISKIVTYILEHFDQKTRRTGPGYSHTIKSVPRRHGSEEIVQEVIAERRVRGFNALFATASIQAAKLYYMEFARQQAELPESQRLKVGIIYSYAPNEVEPDGFLGDEAMDAAGLDRSSREFLDAAIEDYNAMFGSNYDTSGGSFENYYKDLSMKIKNREIDLVIVVNMFLTGFDATTLNTLFVDKNLRMHGLIQAFSRTNRILNSVKTYGNVVCFRNLREETDEALELFGNKDARGIVVLKPFEEYYAEYGKKVDELRDLCAPGETPYGENNQRKFVKIFGAVLRLENILASFDDFLGKEKLTEREGQDYRSVYLDLYAEMSRDKNADKEDINDDLVFELELVKQVQVNVDYILLLVEKHHTEEGNGINREIRAQISRSIDASPELRNKKDLLLDFVDSVTLDEDIDRQWEEYVSTHRRAELDVIIADENLKIDATYEFVNRSFEMGQLETEGTSISDLLPSTSIFGFGGGEPKQVRKERVTEKLQTLFERFKGLSVGAAPIG